MYQEIWSEFFKSLNKQFAPENLSKEGRKIIEDIITLANDTEERVSGNMLEENFNEQNK